MNSVLKLAPRSFPSRVADLGFTTVLPADWISHELPQEEVDVSNPTAFLPLAVVTAPHAALVFAFAARPAHDDGTLHDWAWYHLNHNQLQPRAVGRGVIAGLPAVVGEATQTSDLGPIVVRFAFLEDGNRLLNLSFTTPELLADVARDAWFAMLQSFQLETPRGSRFPIEEHADNIPAAPIPEPWLEKPPEAAAPPEPEEAEMGATSASDGEESSRDELAPAVAVTEERPSDGKPAWWHRARALEAQDQLEVAENMIREACPHIGLAASTAEMYRLRMNRLKAAGDRAGARAAFKKASDFIAFYASLATSGGEGAALSDERDQFRAQLVAEFGGDPEK